jgi:hypothetical protein
VFAADRPDRFAIGHDLPDGGEGGRVMIFATLR